MKLVSTGLEAHWFPLAWSGELGRSPMGVSLLGRRLVLFRDRQGRAAALEDFCPHRGVSLSLGTVRDGTLACAYHGWRFASDGACVHVPSATASTPPARCRVPSFATVEQDGVVWVRLAQEGEAAPPRWPLWGERGYSFDALVTDVECPLPWVVQNFVDCAHTGILHRGLFRGEPSRDIEALVERRPDGVHVENLGETNPGSLGAWLLSRGSGAIRHTDTYRAPHTVEVNYWWGEQHFVTTSVCTPLDERRTRIYTRLGVRFGLLNRVVLAALRPLTARILAQDVLILEDQARQLERYPDRPLASTPADLPCLWVHEVHRQLTGERSSQQVERRRRVAYRL
ncbi:aromatic ring-hydroxylating oxygenase subunit alpha [Archangium lipolyticum]|uniref:aromatic ring-hydroxylating oxygenase subunit alpha n=1 Tax=Archangium lipolyticum TaxID=2970465 RepID=UPI00214A1C8F|nr:aromatic ring-hydroxylating dioxygenase subunit alpha [Archangium lipolyticum]